MFQRKKTVTTTVIKKSQDNFKTISPIKKIVLLVNKLIEDLHITPSLRTVAGNNTLSILFENISFDCDEFFEDYGGIVASISNEYDISLCGIINDLEIGELFAFYKNDKLCYEKSNVSGKDFDIISELYIKVTLKNKYETDFLFQLLSSCNKSLIPFSRRYAELLGDDEYIGENELTHFLYLTLDNLSSLSKNILQDLTIPQLTELWLLFLRDNVTVVEFDMIYEQIHSDSLPCLLRLELSLQLALSELKMKVINEASGFEIFNANDERVKFDFSSMSTAEKIFLKILFPVKV